MSFLAIQALGFAQITGLAAATRLTPPAGANLAIVRATGQPVMWRDDGIAPTVTVGMPILLTDPPFEYAGNLSALQFIQVMAGAALAVSFYRIAG